MDDAAPRTLLYLQPAEEKPYVVAYAGLKKGEYRECTLYSIPSFICFSDAGAAAWKSVQELGAGAAIHLKNTSWLEEDKAWEVSMKAPAADLELMLRSSRYKHIGNYSSAFILSLESTSGPDALSKFMEKFLPALGRMPPGNVDWEKFEKKAGVKREAVEGGWKQFIKE